MSFRIFVIRRMLPVALAWLFVIAPAHAQTDCSQATVPEAQCTALVDLYNSTNGPGWSVSTQWLGNDDPCGWHGVSCFGSNVVDLDLSNNNLVGTVPASIGGLTELEFLFLGENLLTGPLPDEMRALDKVLVFDISFNRLGQEGLGTGVGDMEGLIVLDALYNRLTDLPSNWHENSQLQSLNLEGNVLTSMSAADLPSSIEVLILNQNQIRVFFPNFCVQGPADDLELAFEQLVFLDVAGNSLGRSGLPSCICNAALLQLELGYNTIGLDATDGTDLSCFDTLDTDWDDTQTVPPENVSVTTAEGEVFDTVTVSWEPISYAADGGGYRILQSINGGAYETVGVTADKTVSSVTFKIESGNTDMFRVETFTDAHALQPSALISELSAPKPIIPSGPLLAEINQIDQTEYQALDPIFFDGRTSLGHQIVRYTWTAQAIDENELDIGSPIQLATIRSFVTNGLLEGRYRIRFEAEADDGQIAFDDMTITVQEDRTTTDLEIRSDEIEFLPIDTAGPSLEENAVGEVLVANQGVRVRFTARNLSAISENATVRVRFYSGEPEPENYVGEVDIPSIEAGGAIEEDFVWADIGAETGYRVLTATIAYPANFDPSDPDYRPPGHPDYPRYPETTQVNNRATHSFLVGEPIVGSSDIDAEVEFDTSGTGGNIYAGIPMSVVGNARYAFGNRLPVMGASVRVAIIPVDGAGLPTGPSVFDNLGDATTTAPVGSFWEQVLIDTPGTYQAIIEVSDENLEGSMIFDFTAVEPPRGPNLYLLNNPYRCLSHAVEYVDPINGNDNPLTWREGCNLYTVEGAELDVRANLRNTGNEAAEDYQIEVWDGAPGGASSTLVASYSSLAGDLPEPLVAGDSTLVRYRWVVPTLAFGTTLQAKTFCMRASVADDLNSNDNVDCRRIYILPRAVDLVPRVSIPTYPVQGKEALDVRVDIYNFSPIAIETDNREFDIDLYSGQPGKGTTIYLGRLRVDGAALQRRGDRISVSFTVPATSMDAVATEDLDWGWHPIWAVVDPTNDIEEARDNNNRHWSWACLYRPDVYELRYSRLSTSKRGPIIGDALTFKMTVRNKGELDYDPMTDPAFEIEFFAGHPNQNDLIDTCVLSSAVAGRQGQGSCSVGWTAPDTPGSLYVYARLPNGQLAATRITIYADPPPDLQLFSDDIELLQSNPTAPITVRAAIRNVSTRTDANNFRVRFIADSEEGIELLDEQLHSLLLGESLIVTAGTTLIPEAPVYAFLVELVPNPDEGDANTRDNAATTSWPAEVTGPTVDFGDAPASYGTLLADDGARHLDGPPEIFLGSTIDREADGTPSPGANTDGGDDGVTFAIDGSFVGVQVTANVPCQLRAWVDFDADGSFQPETERVFDQVLAGGLNALDFTVPPTAVEGETYARFRCTSLASIGPTGEAPDGEVEDYVLSIVPQSDLGSGLSARFGFDEGQGCDVFDLTGNLATAGRLEPSCPTDGPTWESWNGGSALAFDGNDYVRLSSVSKSAKTAGSAQASFAAWIRHPSTSVFRAILDQRESLESGYNLYIAPDSVASMRIDGHQLLGTTSIADDVWHHVAGVFDGTTMRLYVDGQLDAEQVLASPPATIGGATGRLMLGRKSYEPRDFFVGRMDDVRIYSRALGADEITALYAAADTGDLVPPVISDGQPGFELDRGTTETTMSVVTDENAECRHSTVVNTAFAAMTDVFATTGGTAHQTVLTGLADNESYIYYVRCRDVVGNGNIVDYPIAFSIGGIDLTSGLLGYWQFEDDLSDCFADDSVGSLDGELGPVCPGDAPQALPSLFGVGLDFDGANDRVEVPATPALSQPTLLTVSAWIKHPPTSRFRAIVDKRDSLTDGYDLFIDDGPPVAFLRVNDAIVKGQVHLDDSQWHHVVGVYDGAQLKVFVDGLEDGVAAVAGTQTIDTTGSLFLGRHYATNNYTFAGELDEVRIYDRALTTEEIVFLYQQGAAEGDLEPPTRSDGEPAEVLPAGTDATLLAIQTDEDATCRYSQNEGTAFAQMTDVFSTTGTTLHETPIGGLVDETIYTYFVRCEDADGNVNTDDATITFAVSSSTDIVAGKVGEWLFEDDPAGCTAADTSGSLFDGTLGPNCSGSGNAPMWTSGRFGGGLSFDGVDDEVEVTDPGSLQAPSTLTLSAWVKLPRTTKWRAVVDHREADTLGYNLYVNSSSKAFMRINGETLSSDEVVADDTWHHLTGTYDGNEMVLYLDGRRVRSKTVGSLLIGTATTTDLLIGHRYTGNSSTFSGVLDGVRIYDRALSDLDVVALFLAGP